MGLFSRKKKMEVPEPPSEDLLKFPKPSEIKAIKSELPIPQKVKEAVGIEKMPLPETPPQKELEPLPKPTFPPLPEKFSFPLPETAPLPEKLSFPALKPSFLRLQHYQMLFDDVDFIKKQTMQLEQINENLEKSGYNEGRDYERLKNSLKKIHDSLLLIDDLIFKKG